MHFIVDNGGLPVANACTLDEVDNLLAAGLIPNGSTVRTVVTASDVKAEAQRRIIALMGVTTFDACVTKQLNANSRATELVDLALTRSLMPDELAEAGVLRAMRAAIVAIRARSNDLEAMNPIPSDYTDDSHWA